MELEQWKMKAKIKKFGTQALFAPNWKLDMPAIALGSQTSTFSAILATFLYSTSIALSFIFPALHHIISLDSQTVVALAHLQTSFYI